MPFNYERPDNYVGTIADLMRSVSAPQAQSALQIGQAQADAARAKGNLWMQALGNIGQSISSIPNELRANQLFQQQQAERQQQMALGKFELNDRQRAADSTAAMEAALRNPANLTNGQIDDDKVVADLKSKNSTAWQSYLQIAQKNQANRLDVAKKYADLTKTTAETDEIGRKAELARREYLGGLAWNGLSTLDEKPNDPLHARDTFLATVAHAAKDGAIQPDQANAVLLQTMQATPDQLRQIMGSFLTPEARQKGESERARIASENATAAWRKAETARLGEDAKGPKLGSAEDYIGKWAAARGLNPAQLTAEQTAQALKTFNDSTAKTPASIQVFNQSEKALSEMPDWANDASRPSGPMPDKPEPKIGGLSPRGLYQGALTFIETGQIPPQGRGSDALSKAKLAAIQNKASAIASDAGMDIPTLRAVYRANAESLKQLQKQSDQVQSYMAAADKNAKTLEDKLSAVPDLGNKWLNSGARTLADVFGSKDMAGIAPYVQSVQREYARILNGGPNLTGQLTDTAAREAAVLLDPRSTVDQFKAALASLNAEGGNRVKSLGEQIRTVTGRMGIGNVNNMQPPLNDKAPGVPSYQDYLNRKRGGA